MSGFRARKGIFRAVVLVSVLLLVPFLSVIAVQGQSQGVHPLVFQAFPLVGGSVGQPVSAKADATWGDKTVNATESYSGEVIVLNGNLTIAGGGSLTLSNVTLMVNCSFDGEHRIEVRGGGSLFINDTDGDPSTRGDASNITGLNSSNSFLFWVDSGATFQMNNSEVHYCGYYNLGFINYLLGLWINANSTIIMNNTFSNNYIGLVLDDAHHNIIRDNSIVNNEVSGLELYYGSDNNITGNTATNDLLHGFYLWYSSNNILTGNTAANNHYGFMLDSSSTSNNTLACNNATGNWYGFMLTRDTHNNNLTGNVAINNTSDVFEDYGFWLDSSSDNNLTGNTAVNSEYGFFVNASSSGNDLFGDDAVNCSVQGYYLGADCVGNDLSGSVVSNFLRVRVVDLSGVPVSGVDVRVASDGTDVYASAGYGGSNSSTGVDGLTDWFAVPYQRYSGETSSGLVVEAWAKGYGYRVVNMSSSHTETFSETESLLTVVGVFFAASQSSQGIPTVLVVGGLLSVALTATALTIYILRRRT